MHLAQLGVREMVPPEARWSAPHGPPLRSGAKKGTYVLASPYSSAGALTNCLPSLHRLHLYVSCVSHSVSVLKLNSCRRSSCVKCRAVSSASSTTQADRFCFWHLGTHVREVRALGISGRDVLSLEDFLLYCSSGLEAVHEA